MLYSKISIITLTFNNSSLLETAIASVYSQQYISDLEIEYMIVDDGSSLFDYNKVNQWIRKYEEIYENPKIKSRIIINPSNIGTVRSLNNACKLSEGDIIIPLSADDVFYNDKVVSEIAKYFNKHDVNTVTTYREMWDKDFSILLDVQPSSRKISLFEKGKEKDLLKFICTNGNIISGANTYYLKKHLEINNFFDEKYYLLEDYPFYIRQLESNETIDFLPVIGVKYRIGGVSTNKNKVNQRLLNDFKILYKEILNKDYLSNKDKRRIFYLKCMTRKDKIKFINIILYFDLCAWLAVDKLRKVMSKNGM